MSWKIDKRRGACHACSREFAEGERHMSWLALVDTGLAREDRCLGCRGGEETAAQGERRLFWWYTRHHGDRKRTVQLDLETLERMFLEFEGREERAVRELRYLLCLLLMRKRRLKVERVDRDREGESFVVKRPRRDERHRVYVFDFDAARMEELRLQLQAIFDGAEPEHDPQQGSAEPTEAAASTPADATDPSQPA